MLCGKFVQAVWRGLNEAYPGQADLRIFSGSLPGPILHDAERGSLRRWKRRVTGME